MYNIKKYMYICIINNKNIAVHSEQYSTMI